MMQRPPVFYARASAYSEVEEPTLAPSQRKLGVRKLSVLLLLCTLLPVLPALGQGPVSVLTYHNDNSRSGLNANETFLSPVNFTSTTFGKIFAYNVDGYIVAQPLYVANVSIPGQGVHNVVYVATQHDSLYAFDADNVGSGAPLWQVSFADPSAGVSSVPIAENGCGTVTGFPEVGIMGTPVIDPSTGTLYVSVKTKEVSGSTTNYVHRLHAIDITNGVEKFGGPVMITGQVPGPNGGENFDPLHQNQRPGLLLVNGLVYIAFGSNGCDLFAHGWLMAYNAADLQQLGVYNTSAFQPNGGSIWQSGAAPAADSASNVYVSLGNGTFNVDTGGSDFADSVLKLAVGSNGLTWTDYFEPFDQANMAANLLDLGSGGILILPDQPGQYPHVMVTAGKSGTIYVINRDNLGQYNPISNSQIPQSLANAVGQFESIPVYWSNKVYFWAINDTVKQFTLKNGLLSTSPTGQSRNFDAAGIPSISANGNNNGILWLVKNPSSPTLSAVDALKMTEVYNSALIPSRDKLGNTAHFITPTVANGKVFVGTQTQLVTYGLLSTLPITGGNNQTGAVATTLPAALAVQAVNPYSGGPVAGVTVTFTDNGAGGTFSNPTAVTDSSGTATTTYTLPTKVQTVTINVSSPGYISSSFSETAVAGPPAAMTLFSGGGQSGTVGTTLPTSIVVTVQDAYANPVIGTSVTFSDGGVGGSFSANPVITNLQGNAPTTYTLPTKAQTISMTATAGSASLNFTENAVAGPVTSMAVTSGGGQTGTVGTTLPASIVVNAKDVYGNNVVGASVTFSDGGVGGNFSPNPAITNNAGSATTSYTLPTKAQTITLTASVGSVSKKFSEKAVPGAPAVMSVNAGGGQTGTVGTTLPTSISVAVKDTYGNPISGVPVTFSDGAVGGSFSPNPVNTNLVGNAITSYTLPTKAQTINAKATVGSLSAKFSEKAVAGAAAAIAVTAGGGQTGTVGTTLPTSISVSVKDAFGNAVSGASVTFSDGGGGGSFSANPVTTNSSGIATTTYTLPTKTQTLNMTASAGSASASFTEKAVAGSPASMIIFSGNHQTAPPNTQLPAPLVVSVLDQYGNPVQGAVVGFTDNGGGGTFSSPTAITGVNGNASVTYTTGSQTGIISITASVSGANSVTFSETVQ